MLPNFLQGAMILSTANYFDSAAAPIVDLINSILTPLITVVGALGAIWCVLLGVKLAKADEPQEREKAKMALKNAIVGYLLIFILIVVLRLTIGPLSKWMADSSNTSSNTTSMLVIDDEVKAV
ncbi:MAG: pilin [Lachnospiraceae bacterium]|nr:pilin [Lachnospiraceae bacterium]